MFAAIAGEVIPEVLHRQAPARVASGFVLGVAVMFGIQRLTERGEASAAGAGLPWGLVAAVGVDALLDGLVIGIGFTAGVTIGVLVTIALSLEMFCLNPLLRRLNG